MFHDLRHTFGTQFAASGIDLRRIQHWMGHADIQTTMRYLHYVPAHDDAARLTAAFTTPDVEEGGHPTGTEVGGRHHAQHAVGPVVVVVLAPVLDQHSCLGQARKQRRARRALGCCWWPCGPPVIGGMEGWRAVAISHRAASDASGFARAR